MINYTTPSKSNATDSSICRKCGSDKITFWKKIHLGKKQKQYHYGVDCRGCGKSYMVSRSKYVFDKIKDDSWRYPKRFRNTQTLNKTALGEL